MKKKMVWLIAVSVFTIDFITTIIALNLFPKGMFVEANPIANWFFSFGWIGWVANYIMMLVLLFLVVQFIFWVKQFDKKRLHKDYHVKIFLGVIIVLDGFTILNNIKLMISAL